MSCSRVLLAFLAITAPAAATAQIEPAATAQVEPAAVGEVESASPFAPKGAVVRLGLAAGYHVVESTTKVAVAIATQDPVSLPVSDLPAGQLFVAVSARPSATGACSVTMHANGSADVLKQFALPSGREAGWIEVEASVEATRSGELQLSCEAGVGEVTWSQPLVFPKAASAPHTGAPLILLVSLDTFRADYIAAFGGESAQSPNLSRFAAEGLSMTATTSEGTWTLPSHYSLFRSRLFQMPKPPDPNEQPAALAEVLGRKGFATAGMTGGGWVGPGQGFHRGFDHFLINWNPEASDFPPLRAELMRWLDRSRGTPTFLFLHTYAAHLLSPPVRAYRKKRGGTGFPKRVDQALERAHYSQLVLHLDDLLGGLFDRLRQEAAARPVLVVVTSDHGQALGDHGFHGHGKSAFGQRGLRLFDELVRVPLIVWSPGEVEAGRTSSRPTNLSDIAPTLISAVGAEVPATMTGANLWAHWHSARAEVQAGPGSVTHIRGEWSLRDAAYKLIVRVGAGRAATPIYELYSVADGARESVELSAEQPERVAAMREQLRERLSEFGLKANAEDEPGGCDPNDEDCKNEFEGLDEETLRQLRALGYSE